MYLRKSFVGTLNKYVYMFFENFYIRIFTLTSQNKIHLKLKLVNYGLMRGFTVMIKFKDIVTST